MLGTRFKSGRHGSPGTRQSFDDWFEKAGVPVRALRRCRHTDEVCNGDSYIRPVGMLYTGSFGRPWKGLIRAVGE